jgi:YqaJ-like viral recombinase domain
MIVHTYPQGSEDWLRARAGKVTASMFKDARSRLKKTGEPTEAALNYAFKVAVEAISGIPMDEGFQTWQMRRGNELEPEARDLYAIRTGNTVDLCSFITTDCESYGASADGLIGEDGGLEIKCLVSPERIRNAILNYDISEWIDQVQGGMWITGRKWWDFVIYCPALSGVGRELTIWHIERDDDYIAQLESDLGAFTGIVNSFIDKLSLKAA